MSAELIVDVKYYKKAAEAYGTEEFMWEDFPGAKELTPMPITILEKMLNEKHEVLYADENIIITKCIEAYDKLSESDNQILFSTKTGELLKGDDFETGKWSLTWRSLQKIRKHWGIKNV